MRRDIRLRAFIFRLDFLAAKLKNLLTPSDPSAKIRILERE